MRPFIGAGNTASILSSLSVRILQFLRRRRAAGRQPERKCQPRVAVVPPSRIARSASLRAASTKIGSFSSVSACSGVFVVERRTMQNSRSGASNTVIVGCGTVRFQNVYRLRR